jgi:ABC-type oligopeptide transport system substrate-binding subunit
MRVSQLLLCALICVVVGALLLVAACGVSEPVAQEATATAVPEPTSPPTEFLILYTANTQGVLESTMAVGG